MRAPLHELAGAALIGAMLALILFGTSPVEAGGKSDEARALERIARAIETRCKP